MDLVIGVDGGNTKTMVLVADFSGRIRGVGRMGSSNWESLGLEETSRVIRAGVDQALAEAGATLCQVKGIHLGLAGMDWSEDHPRLLEAMDWLRPVLKIHLENDAFLGLRANVPVDRGIGVNAGTGVCACILPPEGERYFYGGFTDLGGGMDINARVLHAVIRSEDGRGAPTLMADALLDKTLHATVRDLVYNICRNGFHTPGPVLRQVLFECANAGDTTAEGIVRHFGRELALCATNLLNRYRLRDQTFPVVASGSLFTRTGPLLFQTFREAVLECAPQAEIILSSRPPVVGAVRAALREWIDFNPAVDTKLIQTLPGEEWFRTDQAKMENE